MGARFGLFLGSVAIAVLSAPAMAQDADPLAVASAAQAKGDADTAYRVLKPLETARAGDPAFDYALGTAAIDTKRYGEALIALQRVLAVQPGNAPARAELARAYALAGDIDTARAEFDTVVGDPTVPDPVRQRLTRIVRGFDRQIAGGGEDFTGFVDVEGGYDSNINAATDQTSIVLPAFAFLGPATLTGAAVERSEPFLQIEGGVSSSSALSRQTRAFGSLIGNWRNNLRSGFVDQASGAATFGIAHTLANRDAVSVSGQAQKLLIDGDSYRTSAGGTLRYTKRLAGGAALAFTGDYFRLDYARDFARDADRFGGSVAYSGREFYAAAGAGREQTVRTVADHFSFTFATVQAGGEKAVAEKLSVLGGVGIEYRDHDGSDPLFLKGRSDFRIDASVGLRLLLTERISVRPRVTYTRNESNLALYDYDRFTASVALRLEF